jgi:hypothetical protein
MDSRSGVMSLAGGPSDDLLGECWSAMLFGMSRGKEILPNKAGSWRLRLCWPERWNRNEKDRGERKSVRSVRRCVRPDLRS